VGSQGAGYRRVLIQPQIVRDLASASGTVETVRGPVSVNWTHTAGTITVEVTVPVNSEARVIIPKDNEMGEVVVREGARVVWDKGTFVPGTAGVTAGAAGKEGAASLAPENDTIGFGVGSGHYLFKLTAD